MAKVNMLEAKTKLSQLVEALETGAEREIILARKGTPVARITLLEKNPRPLGLARGEFEDVSDEAWAEWKKESRAMWADALAQPIFPGDVAEPVPGRRKPA